MEKVVGTAEARERDEAAQAASTKASRKSLEDQLAEIETQRKKVLQKIKDRDREARAKFEKDLWALLESEKFDRASIEAWQKAAPAIAAALKAAGGTLD